MNSRKIIHIDMDAFFASVEQRDHPRLRNRPIAVGHSGGRGVVAAASYEARRYGVRSAMPSTTAARLCPKLQFVHPRFEVYKEVSGQINAIFHDYTSLVEPLSLDEAFLDVTENFQNNPSATLIAKEIKERIFQETHLTASAGISYNKFLAKIASDYNKPNGLYVITPNQASEFIKTLDIECIFGVGKVTAERMHRIGIYKGGDLLKYSELQLNEYFGKGGSAFYNFARGIDNRAVVPNRTRKSVGTENTFSHDLTDIREITEELQSIEQDLLERLKRKNFLGKTLTLKIKFSDFQTITRSRTVPFTIQSLRDIAEIRERLLSEVNLNYKSIRLMGLSVSNSDIDFSLPYQLRIPFEDWKLEV